MTVKNKENSKRQLLIESSDFISQVKISKDLKEAVQMSAGKRGTLIVKNIPCTILNRVNQNGRIYSTEVMQKALDEAKRSGAFSTKSLLSRGNEHPEESFVAPTEASHVVINAYIKPNVEIVVEGKKGRFDVLFQDWEVLNTNNGKDLKALFEAECSIGTSIRGTGNLDGNKVKDYQLFGCDCVGNPSSSTFTRMPISESVKVDYVESTDKKSLNETFTLTTSSTNVVRDLEKAAEVQAQLDNIGYGTVIKTSTKVDEETDPKTGAQTSITTLEAETSDDVATLDQALSMAKRAMLNGVVNIDSVTIENVKSEQAEESVKSEEKSLKEDDEDLEQRDVCQWCKDEFPISALKKEKDMGYLCNVCAKDIESREGPLDWDVAEDAENDPTHLALKQSGYYTFEEPMEYMEYINAHKEVLTDDLMSEAEEIYGKFTNGELKKELACHLLENIVNAISNNTEFKLDDSVEYAKQPIGEAKEVNPNEGKKFVLKTPAGFVSMDGNALIFKEDPREAFHFVVGKEESGLVHLSGVEKILDAMGIYDVEKYYYFKKAKEEPKTEEETTETKVEEKAACEATPLKEEDGKAASTRYIATVTIMNANGTNETNEIPVSGVELDAVTAEVGNLWDMKSQKAEAGVKVTVKDTATNAQYEYDPASKALNPITAMQEDTGEIQQDDEKLSMEVDDGVEVEKEFDTPEQASVAKAGLEQGTIPGDVMIDEAEKGVEVQDKDDLAPGWYAIMKADMDSIAGPFNSKEEIEAEFAGYTDDILMHEVPAEDQIEEQLFSEPSAPSDDYVEEPLKDAVEDKVDLVLTNIDWDTKAMIDTFKMRAEADDPVTEGDFVQFLQALPDTIRVSINKDTMSSFKDLNDVLAYVKDTARDQSNFAINNAEIHVLQ